MDLFQLEVTHPADPFDSAKDMHRRPMVGTLFTHARPRLSLSGTTPKESTPVIWNGHSYNPTDLLIQKHNNTRIEPEIPDSLRPVRKPVTTSVAR